MASWGLPTFVFTILGVKLKCMYRMTNDFTHFKMSKLTTVSFSDLDQGIEMIIFEPILTTFEASFIFWGNWDSGSSLKSNHHYQI